MDSRRQFLLGLGGCACCLGRTAQADVLTTDVPALFSAGYQPTDQDERGLWQDTERLEDELRHSDRLLRSAELNGYLRGILERLLGRPAPEIRIYIVREAYFNALMAPTGLMIVHSGLLARVRNEAQCAAVLGHEAGHYFRKHSVEGLRSRRRKSAAIAVVSAVANIAAGAAYQQGYNGGSWIDLANSINQSIVLSYFHFNRSQESEADAFGISLLSKAGYAPTAASDVWRQTIEERKQSAKLRKRRYSDDSESAFSTHPPNEERMQDLADTAEHLRHQGSEATFEGRGEWHSAIEPHLPALLDEQIKRNDPGASLYLIDNLARDGWTGLLHFQKGEVYRLRGAPEDDVKAAAAYADSIQMTDAPPEAWRAHGYALLKSGQNAEARDALSRYLELQPSASDANMVRFTLAQ